MTANPKENPAVAAAGEISKVSNRPTLISNNPNPRQRWRGNPPMKRIGISAELRRRLEAMATGRRA